MGHRYNTRSSGSRQEKKKTRLPEDYLVHGFEFCPAPQKNFHDLGVTRESRSVQGRESLFGRGNGGKELRELGHRQSPPRADNEGKKIKG